MGRRKIHGRFVERSASRQEPAVDHRILQPAIVISRQPGFLKALDIFYVEPLLVLGVNERVEITVL